MSHSERENFVPTTAVEARADRLSRDWNAATERAYTVPLHFARAAEKMGDFAQPAIETAINEVRETYDAGYQTYNLVTEVLESDCTGKWSMLLKTALPAAGAALWLLLVPQPQEILEEYLSPKNLKTTGRGGADAKKVKRKPGKSGRIRRIFPRMPDTNKLIADMIPGSQWVQGRKIGAGQRWLFTGINVADRIFWHWLVLEATETFFATWSSGIMESRFCQNPLDLAITGTIESEGNANAALSFSTTVWTAGDTKGIGGSGNDLGDFDGAFDATLIWSVTFEWDNPATNTHLFEFRVRILKVFNEIETITYTGVVEEGSTSCTFSDEIVRSGVRQFELQKNFTISGIKATDGAMAAFGQEWVEP